MPIKCTVPSCTTTSLHGTNIEKAVQASDFLVTICFFRNKAFIIAGTVLASHTYCSNIDFNLVRSQPEINFSYDPSLLESFNSYLKRIFVSFIESSVRPIGSSVSYRIPVFPAEVNDGDQACNLSFLKWFNSYQNEYSLV